MKLILYLSIIIAIFACPVIAHDAPVPDFDHSLEMVLDADAVATHETEADNAFFNHEVNMETATGFCTITPGAIDVLKLPYSRPEAKASHQTQTNGFAKINSVKNKLLSRNKQVSYKS